MCGTKYMYLHISSKLWRLDTIFFSHSFQQTKFSAEPPRSVTLSATGSDRLVIRWMSPARQSSTTSYAIYGRNSRFAEIYYYADSAGNFTKEIFSLLPYTAYTYCVVAFSGGLPSAPVCDTETTLESGYY